MDQNLSTLSKIGNWIATLLLGNTRELIARIDERTMLMQADIGTLKTDMKDVRSKMDEIYPMVKEIYPMVMEMYPKMEILWKDKAVPAHSRRSFNAYGEKVLKESGVKEVIDAKKDELLALIKAKGAKNVYDAEQDILFVVKDVLGHSPEIIDKLKPGAFNTGADLDMVFFVGGIYLRDLILPDLGFLG
ncbi:MAG TPA: hypothetical protein VMA75_04720 [Candidatus Paceibacterota bacterium]|nr:hypothetical protein [Candidatus Paceibacterota bacterium]